MFDFKYRKIGGGDRKAGGEISEPKNMDKYRLVLNIALISASSLMLAYIQMSFILKIPINPVHEICMILSIVFITGIAVLRTRLSFFFPSIIPIILLTVNCVSFLQLGFGDGFSGLWIFVVPPLTYFTAGRKPGFVVSLAVFVIFLIFWRFPRLSIYYYSLIKGSYITIIYLLLFIMAHIYEVARVSKEESLKKLNALLKSERDEFTVMRNSLKTGLFLMNKDLLIQDNYSPLMESMFGISGLSGKKFTDLLTSSLTSAEVSTIADYFDMVRERRFDADMLEDINPLQELKYKRAEDGQVKILRCTFTPIDRISGERVIMGNIEDITAKVEMQKRLQQEQTLRQEQMNNLFEMLHVDPVVFNDFLEDTEYEFEAINDILKNSNISSKEALTAIYQSFHAIKANSIIIGLNGYGNKVHDIETYIRDLLAKPDVTFDDMLNLTVRIESIMKNNDRFKEGIEKIKSFNADKTKKGAADILSEILKRTVYRTAGDIGKKVMLDSSGIDAEALENAPRRVVKEALLQLVRNAVFHGIETPEVRAKIGKKEYGVIKISLKREGDTIHIQIQDDGKGLDFEKIKERAQKMHIIKNNE
ncbi:MAG: hypothetical protein LBC27_09620, partial [Spirochaetaceae bacterium]|nr:hypothetical protein [Spirochaetaceae bacterium]